MNAKHPSIPDIVHDTPDGQPASKNSTMEVWGSDAVAAQLATLDIPFIALNPGASYRGFRCIPGPLHGDLPHGVRRRRIV